MTGKLRLPPLNALRVFHAVAQHRSFRQAADELLVTPQAVGQQIKLLEDTLQVTLFERKGRSIELTESAILPGADLRLTTMVDLPDFGRDDIDMTVQWGYGNWHDYETTLLVPDPKIICCTPAIAEKIGSAQDLTRFTLLDTVKSMRLWPDILRHLRVETTGSDRSIGFDDAATMRRATLQGIGVGLVSVIDAEEDFRSGALVAPLGRDALSDMRPEDVPGFYLVVPKGHLRVKAVASLHRWLTRQDWRGDLDASPLPKPIPLSD